MRRSLVLTPTIILLLVLIPAGVLPVAAQHATPAASPAPVALVWETTGGPESPLADPTSLAFDPAGKLWVTDGGSSRFQIFAPDGTYLETWGTPGTAEGQFDFGPRGAGLGAIAFDASGNFCVAEAYNRRIQKFGPARTFITAWGNEGSGDGQFQRPFDVAVDGAGRVYVIDDRRDDIQVFDSGGRYLATIGHHGSGEGELSDTSGLTVAPDGDIWVADYGNNRIERFSKGGAFLDAWGHVGIGEGEFVLPNDLVVDQAGRVYVTEQGNQRVQVFTPDGQVLAVWGGLRGAEPRVGNAFGIVLDEAGDIYVGDRDGDVVRKFRLVSPVREGSPSA